MDAVLLGVLVTLVSYLCNVLFSHFLRFMAVFRKEDTTLLQFLRGHPKYPIISKFLENTRKSQQMQVSEEVNAALDSQAHEQSQVFLLESCTMSQIHSCHCVKVSGLGVRVSVMIILRRDNLISLNMPTSNTTATNFIENGSLGSGWQDQTSLQILPPWTKGIQGESEECTMKTTLNLIKKLNHNGTDIYVKFALVYFIFEGKSQI